MTRSQSTARVRRYFEAHAGEYDRQMVRAERWPLGQHREWATARATGSVLELGVGTGLNFPLYTDRVHHVLGIDVSGAMLEHARVRLHSLGLAGQMEVRGMDAQHLDVPDSSVDTVVSTYAMCTIPDPVAALLEARRVLRPGGRLLLVEHGLGRAAWLRVVQRGLNPMAVRWQADNLLRRARRLAVDAGFAVTEADQVGVAGLVHRVNACKPDQSN